MIKNKKVFMAGVLLIVLMAASTATAAALPDIAGHWAEGDIRELVAMGAITGYPDGTYRPQNTITRAEFSSVLRGALGLAEVPGTTFSDTIGHWGEGRIEALVQAGVIDTELYGQNYNPNGAITREEIAMMTVRMQGPIHLLLFPMPFTDTDEISTGFSDYVRRAYELGIVTGYPDQTFRPLGFATRAEAAVMAIRALRILDPTEDVPTIHSFSTDVESITVGSKATLSWEVSGATAITIDQNVGSVTPYGSVEVSPTSTTTYTLTATNNAGSSTAQATITVTPFGDIILPPGFILPPPSITSFSVDKELLPEGETATLSWEVKGVAAVTIEPGIGEVNTTGSYSVSPSETTTYTLTASNISGSVSKTVKINLARQVVIQPGPVEGMDTWVNNDKKNTNYAQQTYLLVASNATYFNIRRSLLDFNLSGIPENAVIVSAYLSMYQWNTKSYMPEEFNVSAHQITTPWDYIAVTWNNQPHYAKAAESTQPITPGTTKWVSWDIKNLAQGWVDGSIQKYGLLLKKVDELEHAWSWVYFNSSNYTDNPGARPRLDIIYYVP